MKAPHQVMLASAGTGKTFQLTNRFIALIAAGVDPSSILATTFTRKAAGEILQRILSRLAAAAVEGPGGEKSLAELRQHISPLLTRERCRDLTAEIASNIHRLNVKTLDSFFGWMTGCFGLEMGITPGWRIISDEEDSDLREQAIQEALQQADRDQLVSFMQMLHNGGNGRTVHEAIARAVRASHAAYAQTIDRSQAWMRFGPESPPLDERALAHALSKLSTLEMPTTKSGGINKNWQKGHDGNLAAARSGDWELFLSNGLAACIAKRQYEYYRQPITPDIIAAYEPVVEHAKGEILRTFLGRNMATREVMERFDAVYQQRKDQAGAWRFEDVPRRLLSQPLDGRLEHLYYRLDARIRHIMLDEFQDTSLEQFALVEPIVDELLSHRQSQSDLADAVHAPPRSVFVVGDVKQSLYSWRGAEPELLPSLASRWSQLQESTLELNFRSSPIVLETVNQVFEGLPSNPVLVEFVNLARTWQNRYKPHRAAKASMAGTASLYIAPSAGEDASKSEQVEKTLEFAAQRVKAILKKQPQATVGILVRTNRCIPQIIFNLRELGIAASEEGGNPLTDSPPVAAAVSLLQLADHPGDTAALFHVATSPLGKIVGLSPGGSEGWRTRLPSHEVRRIAGEIRCRLMREGYAHYLRSILLRAGPAMDASGLARFEQLIDLAQQFDQQAGTRPAEFVRIVQERGVQEPGRQSVSVMTIHQAKGLEFDAVILPELDRRWQLSNDQVLTDRRDSEGERSPFAPITAVTQYPNSAVCALHDGLAELHRHWQERQISEELCCLYVALTRAVHVLEMIVPPPSPKESKLPLCAAGILRGALTGESSASPGECIWTHPNSTVDDWAQQIAMERKREHTPNPEPEPVELALAAPTSIPTGRLRRRSPSSLEGGDTVDLGLIWSTAGDTARDRGSLLHAWFERIEWLDDGLPADQDLLALAPGLGFKDGVAGDLLAGFKLALRGEIAVTLHRAAYVDRAADTLTVRREWSFAVRDQDPATGNVCLLSGIFDRVIVGRRGGKPAWADILDFKTDRLTQGDEAGLSRSIEHYRPQIRAYRRAAAQMLGLQQSDITARLLFTEIDRVVSID